ncbi:MAG: tol-pal system protein YbgF [Sideroxydans sp.]|nr:tol-pal system protein YbgF [Sideroxydans sp.]
MLQLRAFILLAACFVAPAYAGLFTDDEAHQQIQLLQARVLKLETLDTQHTSATLALQSQLDELKTELRKLRGQNEELTHGLQDAEKREKDFYVDLDTRLRRFESSDSSPATSVNAGSVATDPSDPALENRAFEAGYAAVKAGKNANALKSFQEFLKKYPESVHLPNALYWLAVSQFGLQDSKSALATYEKLLSAYPATPKAADAMLNKAICLQELKQPAAAQKTLKQVIVKYPNTAAADKAQKMLAVSK